MQKKVPKTVQEWKCPYCDYTTCRKNSLTRHLSTLKHSSVPKKVHEFVCIYCNFTTQRKSQLTRHLLTGKHLMIQNDTKGAKFCANNDIYINIDDNISYNCDCGKIYKHKQNLYRHQKNCEIIHKNNILKNLVKDQTDKFDILLKHVDTIQEQQKKAETENKILQNQISELIPKVENTTINNTINNKQKLNINIFLNEQCKDAISMNEFIEKIKITMDDLMITKEKGISEGVSNIFIENMNKLSLHERPMHCTDTKREIVYIKQDDNQDKSDGWKMDEENTNLKLAINKVTHVQRQSLDKWIKEHPNWEKNSKEQEEYMKLVRCCTAECKEDKIIKRLCNNLYINSEDTPPDVN